MNIYIKKSNLLLVTDFIRYVNKDINVAVRHCINIYAMAQFYISRILKRPGPHTVRRYNYYTHTYAVFIALICYQMVSS